MSATSPLESGIRSASVILAVLREAGMRRPCRAFASIRFAMTSMIETVASVLIHSERGVLLPQKGGGTAIHR